MKSREFENEETKDREIGVGKSDIIRTFIITF